jgi:hypothetical protein
MALPYDDLVRLRRTDPSWRLLTADRAPVIAAFLDRAFRGESRRARAESELTVLLEDLLFEVQTFDGEEAIRRSAGDYLTEWAQDDKGWLRKFYPPGQDEPHFDLSPAAERALGWLDSLFERGFIGTESRLLTAVQLLEQIVEGVEQDPDEHIRRLEEQRGEIDRRIAAIRAGDVPVLDDRSVRERFLQFERLVRELLADFRAVEHRFRELDREVRTRIAGWDGDRATLLQEIFGERDVIADSDEGRSFRAFWDFLMTPESQEHLSHLLDRTLTLDALAEVQEDVGDMRRLRRIHYEWIAAGEQTQRTVARLSQQLRRFLDDQAYLENRRIIEILNTISRHGLALAETPPGAPIMEIDEIGADISLPMERPLTSPVEEEDVAIELEDDEIEDLDLSLLFDQVYVDTARLQRQIDELLVEADQVSLAGVMDRFPLREGLAELVGYFSLASTAATAVIDDERREEVAWTDRQGVRRRARLPVVVFRRRGTVEDYAGAKGDKR